VNIPDETVFEIVDDYTVRFSLPEPDGLAFIRFMALHQVSPAFLRDHKFAEMNWGDFSEPGPWGTSPFKLIKGGYAPGKLSARVVLEAYENYWDPEYPKVKTVVFDNTLLGDIEEAMRLCRETEGAVDIVSHIRPLDTLKVAESPFAKVAKSRDTGHTHGGFNQRKKDSKWRDIRLRKAVNYAINHGELWQYCAKGNAYNLAGHIPPGVRGHNPNLTLYTYDTARAEDLLAEAGYPNGFEMTIIAPEPHKLEARLIKSMLERIGLQVTLEVFSYPDWMAKVFGPSMDKPHEEQEWDLSICYIPNIFGHAGTSHLVYPYLEASGIRWIEYDPVYEKMWEDMARTVDEEAQDEKMRQMEKYVYDHAYAVYIYTPMSLYAVNREVNFVPQKSERLLLKETSVTDNHWSVRSK